MGTNSLLRRSTTLGLEMTVSRTAPANPQQRPSAGAPPSTQRNTGFFSLATSFKASSRHVLHSTFLQATLASRSASISAFRASGVAGFLSATGDVWAQAGPAHSTENTTTLKLRMIFQPFFLELHA